MYDDVFAGNERLIIFEVAEFFLKEKKIGLKYFCGLSS